ncbi:MULTISPECIES: patatin-like phospholipase family protein [Mesotoga]|uniref:patatin-like phospholipase family protein n=1 Tax=Mesotoga TaxID=1184396 RepID=UPI002FDA1EAB
MIKALVLGGGGAKGFAHVGVIRALEEKGFVPDLIIGVSAGALVGAGYALLSDSKRLWEISLEICRKGKKLLRFANSAARENRGLLFNAATCFHINTFKALPFGLYLNALKKGLKGYRFSDTRIPFKCVSTIMDSGELFVHEEGSIFEALRASMAIPGIISPFSHKGFSLADGGIVNNIPVSIAKEEGCTLVLAVDLSSNNRKVGIDTSNSILEIIDVYKVEEFQRKELALADVVISPLNKRNIGLLDFSSCIELMNESYEETLKFDLIGVSQ